MMESLREKVKACQLCPVRKECTAPVPSEGPATARIMFIGRNPGIEEDSHGSPFYPKGNNSGAIFNSILSRLHVQRDRVYITNALKCYTSDPKSNRPPTWLEYEGCAKEFLSKEIGIVRPELIVTFGLDAFQVVVGNYRVPFSRHQGSLWALADGTPIFPMYHPAAMLNNPEMKGQIEMQILTLQHIIKRYQDLIDSKKFKKTMLENRRLQTVSV